MTYKNALPAELLKIFETVPDLYLILSPNLTILTASNAYLKATLTQRQEITGRNVFEMFPDNPATLQANGVASLSASLQRVLATGKPHIMALQQYDIPLTAQTGGGFREKYWEYVNTPVLDEHGAMQYIIHKVKDVTEEIRHQQQVEALVEEAKWHENRFREFILQAPVAIGVFEGADHVIALANPLICEIMGRPAEEVVGKPVFEALPELKTQGYEAILSGVYNTGVPFEFKEGKATLLRNGKLTTGFYHTVYQPLRDTAGKVIGIINTVYEVTEQVAARQKIEESEKHISNLLESIPQMTWTNLPDGNVNFYSGHWFNYTGLTDEQLYGWGWQLIVHPDDLEETLQVYQHSLQTGVTFNHKNRLKRHDGSWRWFLSRAVPLRQETGNPTLWVGTSTDIHEQKEAEEALQRITKELAAANEELQAANDDLASSNQQLSFINADMDNFIYTASHDLRAPISNIEGLMNAIIRSLPEETREQPMIQKLSGMVANSIERFKNTLKDLTRITQVQREGNGEDVTELALPQIVEEVTLDLASYIEEANAHITTDIQDCTPIRFSAKNVRSVVYNLLSNAIKYRSPDRQPIIQIACYPEEKYMVFRVKDNGLGIDLSQKDKIFAMFKRLHIHVEGTGVGLYIVKKILENSGGKIEVDSKPDHGSTFRAYFPATK